MAPFTKPSTSNANASNKKSSKKQKQLQKRRIVDSSDDESFIDSDCYETFDEDDEDEYDEENDLYEEEGDDEDEEEDDDDDDEDDDDEDDDDDDDDDEDEARKKYNTRSKNGKKGSKSSAAKEKEEAFKQAIEEAFESMLLANMKGGSKKRSSPSSSRKKNKKNNKKSSKKDDKKKKQKNKRNEDDEDEEDSDSDSDYTTPVEDEDEDDEDEEDVFILGGGDDSAGGTGFIFLEGGMTQRSDEHDYRAMVKEDKNEKCNSDDEQMFMKETYKPSTTVEDNNPASSPTGSKNGEKAKKKMKLKSKAKNGKSKNGKKRNGDDQQMRNKKKGASSSKDEDGDEEEDDDDKGKSVQAKYEEMVKLREDLTQQLKKSPKNKILQNAIDECRKSISELVKKERNKNTEKYFQLVHKDPKKSKDTNEMSYFKKKLSHQEQMKVMRDLEKINALTNTDKPYRLSLLESDIPPKFKAIALQKLNVLKSMDPSDSEYYKMKNWVDGFMRVPYGIYKSLTVRLTDGVEKCHTYMDEAKATLDNCTYGLNDAKMQILQMVGQWITNPDAMGTAIAIKGPPGTGKTTLVREGISKILGREFAFIALGGTSDASFLEGHSYTYEGSAWGKIVSILMEAKCMNPVIYFDELDKISDTPKGEEIASILTHLTDTSQNSQFHDKYFSEVDFDLSKCLFIFSYNDESKVNPILKDRMYRIQTKGYNAKEKIIIARKHLLPKIREQVSFKEEDVVLSDDTLDYIINHPELCKAEQGVRNLKRCLEIIHTKLNLFRLVKPDQNMFAKEIEIDVKFPFTVEKKHVDILIKSDDPMSQSLLAMYV